MNIMFCYNIIYSCHIVREVKLIMYRNISTNKVDIACTCCTEWTSDATHPYNTTIKSL